MLSSLVGAGTPLQGPPSWNSSKPGKAEENKESFDKELSEKMSPKEDHQQVDVKKPQAPERTNKLEAATERKPERQDDKTEEVPEVPAKVVISNNPLEKKAANLRQAAIKKFMDSFESEFNVPPTRLVEAMAQLPVEELTRNPDETADSVVAQLDLSEEQEARAKEMYLSLVNDLGRIDKTVAPPLLVAPDPSVMSNVGIKERLTIVQEQKSMLNHSLDRMNGKFWMKSHVQAPQPQSPEGQGAEVQDMDNAAVTTEPFARQELKSDYDLDQNQNLNQGQEKMVGPQNPKVESPKQEQPRGPQGLSLAASQQLKKASEESTAQTPQAEGQQKSKLAMGGAVLKGDFKNALGKPEVAAPAVNTPAVNAKAMAQDGQNSGEGFSGKNSGKEGKENSGKNSLKTSSIDVMKMPDVGNAAPVPKTEALSSTPSPAALAAPVANVPTDKQHEAAVRQILNQAQYLVNKGGGEVKVQMSPEGMGQVHMKMIVHDGKVNLQMATESKEAKQMIESGLSDLKNSMAAHKLSVEHVKVDVVGRTSTDTAMQNQTQSDAQQRDTSKQFWNNFQENFGNRSRQEAFSDMQALKGYSSTKRSSSLQDVDAAAKVERRRTVEGKGSSVNLVA